MNLRLRQHGQQRMMTVMPLAPGIEPLASALLFSLATEHRRIQIQREARGGTAQKQQHPTPERTPELLDVRLGETEEEVADGVIAGKAREALHRVEHALGPQPFRVGEAPRPHDDGQEKGGECMSQRDGVVGGGLGEGQMLLHLPGQPDLTEEGNETGQPANGGNGLGRFLQNQLGFAKERGNFGAGRFVQGRLGLFKHQSLCQQPFPHSDPFLYFGVRV